MAVGYLVTVVLALLIVVFCLVRIRGPQPLFYFGTSPVNLVRADAPPFLIAHGDLDALVDTENPRALVTALRAVSASPVVYVELPGAHHAFDLFHSFRFEALIDGIEDFAAWVTAPGKSA
ncbi:alpha/beta hydrolase [Streptomyces anulatus]